MADRAAPVKFGPDAGSDYKSPDSFNFMPTAVFGDTSDVVRGRSEASRSKGRGQFGAASPLIRALHLCDLRWGATNAAPFAPQRLGA